MNIKEFAKILGVSTATVSRAFSQNGRISETTRKMILERAAELGYRANVHARNLTGCRSDAIALFYPSLVKGEPDYFISEVMLGINETAVMHNRHLQIYPVPEAYEEHLEFYRDIILGGVVSGIIIIYGNEASQSILDIARSANLPHVGIGPMEDDNCPAVTYSIREGATQVGRYFSKLACRQPAYVGGINDTPKEEGFRSGLGVLGNSVIKDSGGSTFLHGAAAFERLHREHPTVDAVFCANDILAIGFIQAALRAGVKIPEDMAVVGCDDVRIARFYVPSLTTIRFHEYSIGEKAVNHLLQQINGDEAPLKEVIESELIVRDSA